MSEELLQRDLINNPEKIGKWDFYSIGATSIKSLKENNIIRNIDYGDAEKKKVDAIIVSRKNVIAIIEYKTPAEFNTKAKQDKAINQEIEVAKKLNCKLIIATDTKETVWVNVLTGNRIKDENNQEVKYNFNQNDEKLPELIEKIIVSINGKNDQIKPKELVNPTDLAKRIWQIVWSISGATPESCLYSFVELFIFKYLSDLKVLEYPEDFDSLIKLYKSKNPEYVIDYYARNIRRKIKEELFPRGEDGTTIINGTVFVNNDDEAIEGRSIAFEKILKEFQSYGKLENIHPDFKSKLFESFLKESISKKNWGQFFTPLKVVNAIVEMAKDEIKAGCKICDPASGVGKFLLEAVQPQLNQYYKVENNQLKSNIEIFGYDIGFDKDEQKTIILAKANMLIYFSELIRDNTTITKQFSDLFNKSFELKKNSILGTLAVPEEEKYDLILSNPPYVTSGSSNIKEEIKRKGLADYYKVNAMGLEGLFMEWIVKALKPKGKAFIVLPNGIFIRQSDINFRKYLVNECLIDGVISLPEKTFFSTSQKTNILCITKKADKTDIQTEPVFTYLVSEIGESRDNYRFDIEQNDLNDAVISFLQFKGAKQYFKSDSIRCKIQPIEKFKCEERWEIDTWWSDKEKIELGIKEESKKIKLEEFSQIIEDVANNLLVFKEEILQLYEQQIEEYQYKEVLVNDIFDFKRGRVISKKDLMNNAGEYPVYSSNTKENGIFGYLNTFDFDCEGITWTTDGIYAGTTFYRNGKFSITNVCGLMTVKKEFINSIYLPFVNAVLNFRNIATGTDNKKVMTNVILNSNITIKIPTNSKGEFNLSAQQQIAEKYQKINQIKKSIADELEKIASIEIDYT